MIYKSSGVGIRRVARLRRIATTIAALYALFAVASTISGGMVALAGCLAFFAYAGLPFLAHYHRVSDPGTQTSSGALFRGSLHVDGTEIVFVSADGTLSVQSGDIADGWLEPFGGDGQRVVVRLLSGDLGVVEVDSVQRGHAILSAIGLSADKHALRVRTAGNSDQTFREMGLLVSLFVLCIPLMALGVAEDLSSLIGWGAVTAAAGAFVGVMARATVKPVVRVGLDGIEISRGARKRFIAVKDLEQVQLSMAGVELIVASPSPGEREIVTVHCWGIQQAALFARIQEIARGFGASAASASQLAQLDRQGRDLPAWTEALRRVAADDGGDYRRVGLAREDLARVLSQGDQPPERRIGAAIALAASGDPVEKERVRIVAQACASEELRAALDRIAQDEADEALVDAALRPPMRAPGA